MLSYNSFIAPGITGNTTIGLDMKRMLVSGYRNCTQCQKRNPPHLKQQAPLESITSNFPFEKLSWDIMGPLPLTSSGNKYIVVVTYLFSKWVEAFPVKSTDIETLATLLVNESADTMFLPTSTAIKVLIWRVIWWQLCASTWDTANQLIICKENGQVERFNRTLESMLAKVVSDHQTDWDHHLPQVLLAYRTAIHDTTGFTPFHITFGRSPVLPVEADTSTTHK